MARPHLTDDGGHAEATHRRWANAHQLNRKTSDPDYPDSWYFEQCGGCRYWVPLKGLLGSDWGACTNNESKFDCSLMFEHDGCDSFDAADDFGG